MSDEIDAMSQVMSELGPSFDEWATAVWFVAPNGWLQYRAPLDLMRTDLHEVLAAARADRYVVAG